MRKYDILDRIKREGIYYCPFRIKRIKAENIGPIKKVNLDLKDINIVIGSNDSGKTILLRLLHDILNKNPITMEKLITTGKKKGKIRIDFAEKIDNIEYIFKLDSKNNEKLRINTNSKCLLVDNPFGHINANDEKAVTKIMDYLKKFKSQMIITSRCLPKMDLKKINVIRY